MTWLYIPPYTTSTFAPEAACSASPSSSPSADGYAPWCTSNGKPTPRPLSWRGWRMRPWITLLSGMTSSPSANRSSLDMFAVSVLSSSRRDIPASRSPSPGSGLASAMIAIYGRGLMRSLARRNPSACSWKTSPDICGWDSGASGEISKAEATALRRDYSRRRKSARAIAASGCSSSGWPTPRTEDAECCGNHPNAVDSLNGAVALWPTPSAREEKADRMSDEAHQRHKERPDSSFNLSTEARLWATPRAGKVTAEDAERWNRRQAKGGVSMPPLAMQAALWPTPRPAEADHAGRRTIMPSSMVGLVETATLWPTPMAGTETRSAQGGIQLHQTASRWPTPAERDWKGANGTEHLENGTGRKHLDQLPNFVRHCSPLDPQTSTAGGKSSRTTRRLNPRFVEWLMGWPLGWSEIGCVLPGTEWSRWLRAMHSSLCALLCSTCERDAETQLLMEGIAE